MQIDQYSSQYNDLTGRLLAHCASEHPGENVFISPLSILLLLAIAAEATAGQARSEIISFLNEPGNEVAGKILYEFQKCLARSKDFTSANAVCVRADLADTVNKSFMDLILPAYNGKLFSCSNMSDTVNRCAERKTKGMVKNIMPESMNDILFSLLNAVTFESAWDWPVEDRNVKDRYFHNADGSKSRVMMLHGSEDSYIEDENFTGFMKPYEGYDFSFMALLPKDKADIPDLKSISYTALCRSAKYAIVEYQLPEFEFSFSEDLTTFCNNEGMSTIFTDLADFSPLSSSWLKLQAILHKTCIDVSRSGTRAAAVTLGAVAAGCLPPREIKTVCLDRPFIFAIMHSKTGIPVFTGCVNHLDNVTIRPKRLVDKLYKKNKQLTIDDR